MSSIHCPQYIYIYTYIYIYGHCKDSQFYGVMTIEHINIYHVSTLAHIYIYRIYIYIPITQKKIGVVALGISLYIRSSLAR